MYKIVKKLDKSLNGEIKIPSDKSVSHRAVIFASLAKGLSVIKNFSTGQDPHSTLNIFKKLGVNIGEDLTTSTVTINSTGKLYLPKENLDCGNSGTTMRLMSGILARQNFNSVLFGDNSLTKRPMKRIIEPLTLMGAKIISTNGTAPLEINGRNLRPINYNSKISSAQVKSCIILAGLGTDGITTYTEPYPSRNHTEIMLESMGAKIQTTGLTTSVQKSELNPIEIEICGDISSAAYFIVAGLIVPHSEIILRKVGLNPTRTGIIDIVKSMGGQIEIFNEHTVCAEPVGDIKVRYTEDLKSCKISGEIIPRLIDEIPIIAVLATQADGETVILDAQDLRNKESDRIKTMVTELRKLGAKIEETDDGMIICGKSNLVGGIELETYNDHRLAMSLYVASLVAQKETSINNFEWAAISFPEFESLFCKLIA